MNIIEALNQDKPIKREKWDIWYSVVYDEGNGRKYLKSDASFGSIILSIEDILANDWITYEEWWKKINFKEKYPKGVLCYVSNFRDFRVKKLEVIVDFKDDYFISDCGQKYNFINIVRKAEQPEILKEL